MNAASPTLRPSPSTSLEAPTGITGEWSALMPELQQQVALSLPLTDLLSLSEVSRGCLHAARLAVRYVTVSGERLSEVLRLYPHLAEIKLINASDAQIAALAGNRIIKRVDLSGCMHLTDQGVARLSGLASLSELDLRRCFDLGDGAVAALASYPALESLDLGLTKLTDTGLAALARCPTLKHLKLVGCNFITPDGVDAFLARQPQIRNLTLGWCARIDRGALQDLQQRHPSVKVASGLATPLPRSDSADRSLEHALAQFGLV